jgi:hypothetical protein
MVAIMDTQALAVVSQLKQAKKPLAQIMHHTKIEEAISALSAMGYYNEIVYADNKYPRTVADFLDPVYYPELEGRLSSETPVVWFWGGPPSKLKWYRGTLQTILKDRIYDKINQTSLRETKFLLNCK